MNTRISKLLALSAVLGFSAVAFSQDSFSLTSGPYNFIDPAGSGTNSIQTPPNTVAANYVVSATVNLGACVLTQAQTGTTASQAWMRLRNSAYPTMYGDIQMTTLSFSAGTVSVPAGTRTMTGPLVGMEVPAGSTWTIELYDSTNQGTIGLPEVAADQLVFNTNAGVALPTTSFTTLLSVAGPMDSDGAAGTVTNTTAPAGSAATSYLLAPTAILTGTLTKVASGTFASEARFRLRHTDLPGLFADVSAAVIPLSSSAWTALTTGPRLVTFSGTLVGATIPTTGNFTLESFESFNDTGIDSQWTNVGIQLRETPPPTPPTAEDLGTISVPGATFDRSIATAGEVKWYKFTIAAAATGTRFLDIETVGPTPSGTLAEDTGIAIYTSTGSLVTLDTADGLGSNGGAYYGSAQSWGSRDGMNYNSVLRNGQDGALPAGTYYMAVAAGTPTASFGWVVSTTSSLVGDFRMQFKYDDAVAPSAPASFIDLGTVYGNVSNTYNHMTPSAQWFKFTIPAAASGTDYLDIDTEDTTAFLPYPLAGYSFTNDTYVVLYDSAGTRVSFDDDDGSGSLSQLSHGSTTSRGTRVTGANSVSVDRNGRDGNLAAGTYYLAVSSFSIANSATVPWYAAANSGQTGNVTVNLLSNFVLPQVISGTITLNDSDADWSNEAVVLQVVDPSGPTLVATLNATLDASGNYSITPGTPVAAGTYDIYVKGDTFLKKLVAGVTVTAAGATGVNATLTNGDVNNDNEIGPGDFTALSAAFGTMLGDPNFDDAADLNDDDEVGPADFTILSNQFGNQGDDF